MENQIAEVKTMYQRRMYEIEAPFNRPSPTTQSNELEQGIDAPLQRDPTTTNQSADSNMYPSLPPYSSIPLFTANDVKSNLKENVDTSNRIF